MHTRHVYSGPIVAAPPPGPDSVLQYVLEGTVLRGVLESGAPASLTLNLAEEQRDEQRMITVYLTEQGEPTLEPTSLYLAVISIPPRRYEDVPISGAETDDLESGSIERRPLQIDPLAVWVDLFTGVEPAAPN